MESNTKLNAIVIGATGATGREVVDHLLASPAYSKITIFARRIIDRWEKLSPAQSAKLNIIKVESLDFLSGNKEQLSQKLNDSVEYHVLFCCLGSRTGKGEEEFKKVDYTYTVQSCEMCEKLNIPHYSVVSSSGASSSAWIMYTRVKGEADDEILKKKVKYVTVFRPGFITDRDNDSRTVESIGKYIPFVPKITSKLLGLALVRNDLDYQNAKEEKPDKAVIISHSEIVALANRKE